MFQKRINELNHADIQRVIADQVQEGSEVEFKEALPAKDGADPWAAGQERISDRARNEVVAEIIAFANAYGGTLILGVAETSDKPARASAITPIRACANLAERLRLQCRDCVDPQIPLLEVAAVPTREDGAGVVVFQVPRSRVAPHRHKADKECYIRRADRTERIATMREIQGLTLQLERGLGAIERRFEERRERYSQRFDQFHLGHSNAFGMRATLIPLTPLYVAKVHNNDRVQPPLGTLHGTLSGQRIELNVHRPIDQWRPILRGSLGVGKRDDSEFWMEVCCDGLIEYGILVRRGGEDRHKIYPGWVMGLWGSALCAAEKFRRAAGALDVEFGLEFEIVNQGAPLSVGRYGGGYDFGDRLGPFRERRTIFPRYSVGPPAEYQQLSEVFEADFWHAAGQDWNERLKVDFEAALKSFGIC